MRAEVTNRSRGARGFQLEDGSTRFVEPGETARLDLADHVLHRAWEAAGEVRIVLAQSPPERPTASGEKMPRRSRAG